MESGLCKATRMISRGGPCRKLGNASRSSLDGEISLQKKGGNALESALPRDTYWGLDFTIIHMAFIITPR